MPTTLLLLLLWSKTEVELVGVVVVVFPTTVLFQCSTQICFFLPKLSSPSTFSFPYYLIKLLDLFGF